MSAKISIVVEVVTGVAKVQVPAPTRVAYTLVWPGTRGTAMYRVTLVRLKLTWKNFPSTTSSMTRLSLRCTLFPSLSKMPTFNKHIPLESWSGQTSCRVKDSSAKD